MKKIFIGLTSVILIGMLLVSGVLLWRYYRYTATTPVDLPPAVDFSVLHQSTVTLSPLPTAESRPKETATTTITPVALNLESTFYSQAPLGNWDYPWQEACEEASVLLIANEYLDHRWTVEQFNQQILQMVDWQNETFGDYKSTTMEQTAQMINQYLHLPTTIHTNPDLNTVKHILAEGHFIVMPLAGKELGNPFYNNGGPIYHVLVVKGYTAANQVITHDVGTKRGENYVYDWNTLDAAMHDLSDPIDQGAKKIIEVHPPQK